jgi:hypothetical protein
MLLFREGVCVFQGRCFVFSVKLFWDFPVGELVAEMSVELIEKCVVFLVQSLVIDRQILHIRFLTTEIVDFCRISTRNTT